MRAPIAYYDPPRRPAPGVRPDFTKLPLSGRSVIIADMRYRANDSPAFSLSREGFTLVTAPTMVRDFYDQEEVSRWYIGEAAELVRRLTGCAATGVSPCRLRRRSCDMARFAAVL